MNDWNQEHKTDAGKLRFDLVPTHYLILVEDKVCDIFAGEQYEANTNNKYDLYEMLAYCMMIMGGYSNTRRELAKVYTFGANKYGDESWKTVQDGKKRYAAALHRHLDEFYRGNYVNYEDGCVLHIAQVAWNCIAVLYFMEENK